MCEANRLADEVLSECSGDYRKAIDELRHRLDRVDSAENDLIVSALEELRIRKTASKLS